MFNELEVTNPSKRTIVWSKDLCFNKLASDINIKADDLNLKQFDLNQHNMVINGDCSITYGGSVNLNGGSLSINGDFLQTTGTITCNNGTLNINGDYTIENTTKNNVGEIVYNSCSAKLNMTSQYDKVNILGDFITHNLSTSYPKGCVQLHYGILSVGGDIWSDKGISTTNSYGQRTILTGNKKQSVTLGASNKFNILVLTKPESNYSFKPENCWNTLITVEAGSGDVDEDGKLTVADVVLLQKWLLAVPNTHLPCWKAVDMYDDNKLDVFDFCMLKYKLINS